VTFLVLRVFCTRPDVFQFPPKRRHPERSASQIYRIAEGLWRGVEEPVPNVAEGTPAMLIGRCSSKLSGHRLQVKLKSHSLRPERSEVEGSAVFSTSIRMCMEAPPFPRSFREMPHPFSSLIGNRSATSLTAVPGTEGFADVNWAKLDSALKSRILCRFIKKSRACRPRIGASHSPSALPIWKPGPHRRPRALQNRKPNRDLPQNIELLYATL